MKGQTRGQDELTDARDGPQGIISTAHGWWKSPRQESVGMGAREAAKEGQLEYVP